MKVFFIVIGVAFILGGLVGGELTDREFLITGAVIGGVSVGVIIFLAGWYLNAKDEKKRKNSKLTPEIRGVFERMMKSQHLPNVPEKNKNEKFSNSSQSSAVHQFYESALVIIQGQIVPKYSNVKQIFSELMVNKEAAGYVFGALDAILQIKNLRQDVNQGAKILESGYKELFGVQAGYALYNHSVSLANDEVFSTSRMEGGQEIFEYFEKGTQPLGLNRKIFFKNNSQAKSVIPKKPTLDVDYNKVIVDLHNNFRKFVGVKAPENIVEKLDQRSSIYSAVMPLAYGLILWRKSKNFPAYIDTNQHKILREYIQDRIVKHRVEYAGLMVQRMPKLPGAPVMTPDVEKISLQVNKELTAYFNAVSDGDTLRTDLVVLPNLVQILLSEAPYYRNLENKEEVINNFSDYFNQYAIPDAS